MSDNRVTAKRVKKDGELRDAMQACFADCYNQIAMLVLAKNRVEALLRMNGKNESADFLERVDKELWEEYAYNTFLDRIAW